MQAAVFSVIPVELTRDVIDQIVLNGEKLDFWYDHWDYINKKEKFEKDNPSSLVDYLYNSSRAASRRVYAGVGGSINHKWDYFLGLAMRGETYFKLEPHEFELRFASGNPLYKRDDYLHDNAYVNLGWYTQAVLDLTKDLPIKKLHTLLR